MLIPKLNYFRSPKFRRWVSELECMRCGLEDHSQSAHLTRGGRALKGCDKTCRPLCTVHPTSDGSLTLGCHEKLDLHIDHWTSGMLHCALNINLFNYYQDKNKEGALEEFRNWRKMWT